MPKQTRKSWKPPEGYYIEVEGKRKFIAHKDQECRDHAHADSVEEDNTNGS